MGFGLRGGHETYDDVRPEIPDIRGNKAGAFGDPFKTENHSSTQASVTWVRRVKREPYPQ